MGTKYTRAEGPDGVDPLVGKRTIGGPRASWLVGQVGVCAIKLQCVAGKQSKRKFINEQA